MVEHVHAGNAVTFHSVCVHQTSEDWKHLADRIFSDIRAGHLPEICQFSLLQDEDMLRALEMLCQKKSCSVEPLTNSLDQVHDLPLLYWSLFCSETTLTSWCLKYMPGDSSTESFSPQWLPPILFANCLFNLNRNTKCEVQSAVLKISIADSVMSQNASIKLQIPLPEPRNRFSPHARQLSQRNVEEVLNSEVYRHVPDTVLKVSVEESAWVVSSSRKISWYLLLRLLTDQAIDETDQAGNTLLQLAVETGDLDLVRFLLDRGASVIPVDERRDSCFMAALCKGYQEIATSIFQQHPRIAQLCGGTEILYSTLEKYSSAHWVFAFLMKSRFSDEESFALLYKSLKEGNLEMMKHLTDASGINVNARNEHGQTVLHVACHEGNKKILMHLLQVGSCANTTAQTHDIESAKTEVRKAIDIDCADQEGSTALHEAVCSGHFKITELLVSRMTNINCQNSNWESPMHAACKKGET
jgi:ankyrin repeat protein